MKYFILKSYQLKENKKWIPTADLIESNIDEPTLKITEECSLKEMECSTKEEADQVITEYLEKQGLQKSIEK